MIRLTTTKVLKVITGQNGAEVQVNGLQYPAGTAPGFTEDTIITSATTTTVSAAPSGSYTQKHIDSVSIKNTYAGAHTIQVVTVDTGPVTLHCMYAVLQADETLVYSHSGGWQVLDATGAKRTSIGSSLLASITVGGSVTANAFIPNSATVPTNGMFLPAANTLGWAINSAEKLRLDSSGNLGLGVTPSVWLSTYRAIQLGLTGTIAGRTDANRLEISSNSYRESGGGWKYIITDAAARYDLDTGSHTWYAAASGTAGNAITWTTTLQVDSTGLKLPSNSTETVLGTGIQRVGGNSIQWFEGGMYWKSGSTGAPGDMMQLSTAGNLSINGATATKASGTTWANPSDERLKTNIQTYSKGLKELQQLRFVTGEYNGLAGTPKGQKFISVIAQEAQKVIPDAISIFKAKLNPDDTKETDFLRYDASETQILVAVSVQQLGAITTESQFRIDDHEARLRSLRAEFDAYKEAHP